MPVDTDMQYAFTRAIAEEAMAERVKRAAVALRSAGMALVTT